MKSQDLPTGRTSIRLPPELRAQLDEEAKRREKTLTEVIVEVLQQKLGRTPKRADFFD